jgi:hypothetical protein
MANQSNRAPVNKLFASLARIFKAADGEHIADLADVLDVPIGSGDQWNVADHGNKPRSPTSPPEAASGAGGAAMVARYSDPQEGNGITEAYRMFAESIGNLNTRMEKSERGLQAVAMLLANAMGKGKEAAEMFESDPDDEGEKDPDGNSTEKGKVRVADVGGIENLMKTLMGTSRSSVPATLAQPPNLAVVKAGNQWDAAITDADNRGDHREVLRLSTLRMRQNAAAAGAPVDARLLHGADFQLTPVSLRQPI